MKYELTFSNIRKNNDLLFESVRGSHLFGLNTENSDIDTFGLFCCPEEYILDTRRYYQGVVSSDKNDDTWCELEKFIIGLGKSNPNYLEAIFTPDKWIKFYNPILNPLWEIRDSLITKASFKSFGNYAVSQIKKARGLNKAINTSPDEVKERKSVLDFCSVPKGQGTKKVADWLRDNGLKQKYCGLVSLPNGKGWYGLYYDWGTHLICEYGADLKDKSSLYEVWGMICLEQDTNENDLVSTFGDALVEYYFLDSNIPYFKQLSYIEPYGFTGIVKEGGDSNEVRICKVPKGILPITTMYYNQEGYESHCRAYKRYWDWVANRNPERYKLNVGHNFDAKNMSACIRIMTVAKEIAEGKGIILDRTGIDRDFLLDIKNHRMTYDEIISYADKLEREMNQAFLESKIPEEPNLDVLDNILVDIRQRHYASKRGKH